MTNGNRITSTPPGSTPAAHPTPEGQWDAVASLGNPEYVPMEDQWEELRKLADKMGQPLDENNRTGAEMIAKTDEAIVATESGPSVEERRRETLDYLIDNALAAQEGDSDIDVDTIIQEFNKKSEGLWSREYVIDLAKRAHDLNSDEPFNEAESYRAALELGAPIMPIVIENEDFYQNMLENGLEPGMIIDIYQTMVKTEEGKKRFYYDVIESGIYKQLLADDIHELFRSAEQKDNQKILLELRILKEFGVCLLEGVDSTKLKPTEGFFYLDYNGIEGDEQQKAYSITMALVENGLFDGKECTKAIEDLLSQSAIRDDDFGVAKALADAGVQPDSDNQDLQYWVRDLRESNGSMLKQTYDIDNPEATQERLDFSSEAVMRQFCRIYSSSYSHLARTSHYQAPRFKEALRNPVFQDIILQTLDDRAREGFYFYDSDPELFMMLLQDKSIIENMMGRRAFDDHQECQNFGTIRKVVSGELTEQERLSFFLGRQQFQDKHFNELGNPTDEFFWDFQRDLEDGFYLDEIEKKKVEKYRKINELVTLFQQNGSKVFFGAGGLPDLHWAVKYFDINGVKPDYFLAGLKSGDFGEEDNLAPKVHPPGLDWSEYFGEAGPKLRFWQEVLSAEGSLQYILTNISQENLEKIGISETVKVILGINKETLKRTGRDCWLLNTKKTGGEILGLFDTKGPTRAFWQTSLLEARDYEFLLAQDEETKKRMGFDEATSGFLDSSYYTSASTIINMADTPEKLQETIHKYFNADGPTHTFWQATLEAMDFSHIANQDRGIREKIGFDEITDALIDTCSAIEQSGGTLPRGLLKEWLRGTIDESAIAFIEGYGGKVFSDGNKTIDESNIIQVLTRFMDLDHLDWDGATDDDLIIKEAFNSNSTKNLALSTLKSLYEGYLEDSKAKGGENPHFPLALVGLSDAVQQWGGAGPLTQIEAFLSFAGAFGKQSKTLVESTNSPESLEVPSEDDRVKMRNWLQATANMEQKMAQSKWDDSEKSEFYTISAEIINADPEIYQTFAELLFNIPEQKDFKKFATEVYPLFRARLSLDKEYVHHGDGINVGRMETNYNDERIGELKLQLGATIEESGLADDNWEKLGKNPAVVLKNTKNLLHNTLLPFNLQELSPTQVANGIEIMKNRLFTEISETFQEKFSIRPEVIPKDLSQRDARVIKDMTIYLSAIRDKNAKKQSIIGYLLALQLGRTGAFEDLRSGKYNSDNIRPGKYMDIPSGYTLLEDIIKTSRDNNPVTKENTGLQNDERLTQFREALQLETITRQQGSTEPTENVLRSVIGGINALVPPDSYTGMDGKVMELLGEYSNKVLGQAANALHQIIDGKTPRVPKDVDRETLRRVMGEIVRGMRENQIEISASPDKRKESLKNLEEYFQKGARYKELKISFALNSKIEETRARQLLEELQSLLNLNPDSEIVQIINKMNTGVDQGSKVDYNNVDLDVLANLLVAKQGSLSDDEYRKVKEYGDSIDRKRAEISNAHRQIVQSFESNKSGAPQNAHEKIGEIENVIHNRKYQTPIVTVCTSEPTTTMENTRGCLNFRNGQNNDTGLSALAEGYIFYMCTKDGTNSEGSISDAMAYFVPLGDKWGNRRMGFVMDKIYGVNNEDIQIGYIRTLMQKATGLSRQFEEVPTSVFLPHIQMSPDYIAKASELPKNTEIKQVNNETVTIPTSGFSDHYIEFGNESARTSGPRKVSGIEIVINPPRMKGISFFPIGEDEVSLVANLEKRLYPDNTLQYEDSSYLRERLRESGSEKFSFIVSDQVKGKQQPVGYCMASYIEEPMSNESHEGKVVEISDFGIIPEDRSGRAAWGTLLELLKRTEADGVDLIEMEALEDTSYRAFSSRRMREMLARQGYTVTDHGIHGRWVSRNEDGETVTKNSYLITLKKTGHPTNQG